MNRGGIRWGVCGLMAAGAGVSGQVALAGENFSRQESVSLFQILGFGIEINITLLLMLFLAIFLVVYTLLTTRRRKVMPYDQIRKVQDFVSAGNIEQAIGLLQAKDTLFSRTVLPGLKLYSHSHDRICAAMEAAGRRALGGFRQKITYIANLATLAPMLGLLGTVLGLTKAFNVMGGDDPIGARSTMMTGYIGEAMGTTVVGLLVGIPAMAAYYLCMSRLGRLGDDLEAVTEEIAVTLAEQNLAKAIAANEAYVPGVSAVEASAAAAAESAGGSSAEGRNGPPSVPDYNDVGEE